MTGGGGREGEPKLRRGRSHHTPHTTPGAGDRRPRALAKLQYQLRQWNITHKISILGAQSGGRCGCVVLITARGWALFFLI
eukprot:scaffold3318_cov110-Isochrysis_galbana.AAC.6